MPKIDITKTYQTRDGKKVRLISDQGSEEYPIVGYVADDTSPICWTAEGAYYSNAHDTSYDLIPVPQIIKTRPYRRYIRLSYQTYHVDTVAPDPADPEQIQYIETLRSFVRWVDADWITESVEITT